MTSKLMLAGVEADPVVPNSASAPSYMIRNFKDELTDYNTGNYAKLQKYSIFITPKSGLGSVFNGNSTTIDWNIAAQKLDHFENMQIRMVINNPSAANIATLLPVHFLIDKIELIVGSETQSIYNYHLFMEELFFQKDDNDIFNNRAFNNGFLGGIQGTPYAAPATLAVSSSRVVYMNIPNWLTKTQVFIPGIRQDITLRIYFSANATTTGSAQQIVTLSEADLHIDGKMYDLDVKQRLINRYRSFDHCLAYFDPQRAEINGQPIGGTSKSNVSSTEFSNYVVPFVAAIVVPNGAVREDQYNFQALSIAEYVRNGDSLLNYDNAESDWIRLQTSKKFFTTAISTNNIYILQASDSPVLSVNHGILRGSLKTTVNDALALQAVVGGTYKVVLVTYRFACANIKKDGSVVLQRS